MGRINVDSTGGASRRSEYPPVSISRGFASFLANLIAHNVQIASISDAYRAFETLPYGEIYPYIAWIKASECSGSASLSDALALAGLDKTLRRIMLRAIETIEKQTKAQYRNSMVSRYGEFCLCDSSCYRDERSHGSTISIVQRELQRRSRNDSALSEALRVNRMIPCDVALGAFSFGSISRLVGNTSSAEVLKEVAASFGIDVHRLKSWLKMLTAVRNACAHFESYIVKSQIPSVPFRVKGVDGDYTSPLYALLVIDEMLSGRVEYLGYDDGILGCFELEAARVLDSFAGEHPALVESLRVPREFLARADSRRLASCLEWLCGCAAYQIVNLAA